MSRRALQVSRQVQETLSLLLEQEIRDPRLHLVTLTKVHTTDDLKQATVYFSVLEDERRGEAIRALRKASGFLRRELSARLNLRYTPTLSFVLDDSFVQTKHLLDILDEISAEQKT
ncbi:MAG: 30S ribosome-binding factor RbfA [Chloroflexi bacterium]|nr:30S ribosome-binding factor RbfA [Chloroflexota bacterium]